MSAGDERVAEQERLSATLQRESLIDEGYVQEERKTGKGETELLWVKGSTPEPTTPEPTSLPSNDPLAGTTDPTAGSGDGTMWTGGSPVDINDPIWQAIQDGEGIWSGEFGYGSSDADNFFNQGVPNSNQIKQGSPYAMPGQEGAPAGLDTVLGGDIRYGRTSMGAPAPGTVPEGGAARPWTPLGINTNQAGLPEYGSGAGQIAYQPKYQTGTNLTGEGGFFQNANNFLSGNIGGQFSDEQAAQLHDIVTGNFKPPGQEGGGEGETSGMAGGSTPEGRAALSALGIGVVNADQVAKIGSMVLAGALPAAVLAKALQLETTTDQAMLADITELSELSQLTPEQVALAIINEEQIFEMPQTLVDLPALTEAGYNIGGSAPGGGSMSDAEGEAAAAGGHEATAAGQMDASAEADNPEGLAAGFGGGSSSGGSAGGAGTAGSGTGEGASASGAGAGPHGGNDGGGGGGGGDGKVICTALNNMYGFGSFRNKIWLEYDAKIGSKQPDADLLELGYHKLFMPMARRMPKHPLLARILRRIVTVRSARCRNELRGQPITFEQKAYKLLFETPCKAAGWLIKKGFLKPEKVNVRS